MDTDNFIKGTCKYETNKLLDYRPSCLLQKYQILRVVSERSILTGA